jgi:hypothetical protein
VLLILVALALAVFGMIQLTKTLQPRQRAVAWVVFVVGIVWAILKLVPWGVFGHAAHVD